MTEPVEIGRFDPATAGRGCRMTLGDLNGDGRIEVVAFQPNGGIDDRYVPHEARCVTAFDLAGNVLWQHGTPDPEVRGSGADIPVQVHDIDGDGRLEVLCVSGGAFRILDGATGEERESRPLPDPDAHDCIIACDLAGAGRATDVLLKDRYKRMWAMDANWNVLWTHAGNLGHYPWPHDFDGDGRDEILAGYDLLDPDGRVRSSCQPLEDHADCAIVGRVLPDEPGDQVVIGGSVTVLYSGDGRELWRYEGSKESQHVALGRFRPETDDVCVAGLDRIERGRNGIDGIFVLSSSGEALWKEDRQVRGWLTIIQTLSNWAGDGKDHILAYRRRGGLMPALYDGHGNAVVTFPFDGNAVFADCFGRGRTDVILYTDEEVRVYGSKPFDFSKPASGSALVHPKRLSHQTLYPGGEYPSD